MNVSHPLLPREATRFRSQFSCALLVLAEFRAHWHPTERRLVVRSLHAQKPWRLPPGAIYFGTYTVGEVRSDDALEDLYEALLRHQAAPPAPAEPAHAPAAPTSVATPRIDPELVRALPALAPRRLVPRVNHEDRVQPRKRK